MAPWFPWFLKGTKEGSTDFKSVEFNDLIQFHLLWLPKLVPCYLEVVPGYLEMDWSLVMVDVVGVVSMVEVFRVV